MTQNLVNEVGLLDATEETLPERPSASAGPMTAAALAAAVLAACGGGGGGSASGTVAPVGGASISLNTAGFSYLMPSSDEEAARFLLQAQFSASDADIAALRATGCAVWLERQVAQPFGPTGWDWLNSQGYGDVLNPANYYDNSYPADYMIWNQLMSAPDPLRKRVALALSEFFVVSLSGLDFSWRSHAMAHYWDTLAAHALGNYRDLLEAVTLNPAMGNYLNTRGNKKENSSGRQPDENYAREVMQLFTIGLLQLNPDGTPQTDGAGNKIDTYGASDVSNLARVFTGYDLDQSQNVNTVIPQAGGGTRNVGNTAFARLPMLLSASNHSTLAATFLGTTVAANTAGAAALQTALDTLFNHPNTAPFFCRQMIQRLVTSNPSPAYVARVAAVFSNNGAGVRGDLARVFAAILLDDEARAPAGLTQAEFGKLREPMLRLVQWGRTFGVNSSSGGWKIGDLSNAGTQLGQSPLRSPSVFNYFRPGYVPPSTALSAGVVAPEFQLVTESSVGGYLNYMMGVISSGLNSGDMSAPYTSELALVTDAAALVQRLKLLLCAGQLSVANETLIVSALNATAVTATSTSAIKRNRICAAVLMVMASAEYLIQK
ncbi:DUF1800 domain-containing protein [Rhodoferax sp. UBA5149]|uniref:DUF1800 domain-containing protein n=1 Tax=Rhodoferax sp. UBA5149 TaxID=1947379 RepID=UPI0025D4FC47|nr:DUF1800 domain-containing protein [Rhodoferax sp. UBA5149]